MTVVSDLSETFVEKITTHFVFSSFPPPEDRAVYGNVKKYCGAGHTTEDNMARAHCIVDN